MPRKIAFVPSSTGLQSLEYDGKKHELTATFPNGVYTYENIPPKVANGFRTAKSAGEYFHKYIRNDKSITCRKH